VKITKRQLRRIIRENSDTQKVTEARGNVPSATGMEILSIKDALVDIKMGVRYHDEELADDLALQIDRLLTLGYSIKEGRQIREGGESTIKYNANPALIGDQTTLPDEVQKGIIDKAEDEDEAKNEGTSLEDMPDAWRQVLGDCLGGTK